MNARDKNRLEWIKEESEYLLEKAENCNVEDFVYDKDLQHIVAMALINIGESVASLSKELKQRYPNIEWREITDLRNIAAHNYDGLRMEDIWDNVTDDIPELLEQVQDILHSERIEE
jgi:uncharacterized protein with HEPN domain